MSRAASIGKVLAAGLGSGGFVGGGRRWTWTGPEVAWVAEIEAPRSAGRWALDLGAELPLAGGQRSGEWSIQLPAENIRGASIDMIDALYVRSPLDQDFRNAVSASSRSSSAGLSRRTERSRNSRLLSEMGR